MNNEDSNDKSGSNPDPLSATEMFLRAMQTTPDAARTLEPSSLEPTPPAQPEVSDPAPAASAAPVPPAQPVAAGPAPGEFTQFMRQLTVPEPPPGQPIPTAQPDAPVPAPTASAAPVPPAQPVAAGPAPGEFTQIFRPLKVPEPPPGQPIPTAQPEASDPAPTASAAPVPPAQPVAAAPAPGEFTQIFRPLKVPEAAPAPAADRALTTVCCKSDCFQCKPASAGRRIHPVLFHKVGRSGAGSPGSPGSRAT